MEVKVCFGKACQENFSPYIKTRLENDIKKFELKNINLENITCMGECKKGPNIKIDGEIIVNVNPAKASELLFKKLKNVNF